MTFILVLFFTFLNLVTNPDLEIRFSGRVGNVAFYPSARPDQDPPLFECVLLFILVISMIYFTSPFTSHALSRNRRK